MRADFERREPRCRICRDEAVRILVNELLDWRGVPIILGRGKTHRITLTEILRDLEPLNEGRDKKDQITYDCLWITPRATTTLPGQRPTGEPGCPRSSRSSRRPCGDNGV